MAWQNGRRGVSLAVVRLFMLSHMSVSKAIEGNWVYNRQWMIGKLYSRGSYQWFAVRAGSALGEVPRGACQRCGAAQYFMWDLGGKIMDPHMVLQVTPMWERWHHFVEHHFLPPLEKLRNYPKAIELKEIQFIYYSYRNVFVNMASSLDLQSEGWWTCTLWKVWERWTSVSHGNR